MEKERQTMRERRIEKREIPPWIARGNPLQRAGDRYL